jgi:iron complex transport system substrate-binding protein
MVDREGYAITVPAEINTLVTIGPPTTEIVVGLGLASKIIGTDRFSGDVAGLPAGVVAEFGITDFDAEYIVNLMPDVVFVTGMTRVEGDLDPLAPVSSAGITVIYIPTSVSIAAIMEDIRFIADVMDVSEAGGRLISAMQDEIREITAIAATITQPRTVYFEVSPAPWMYSFGTGTFLHEMIELVGAVNIFADQRDWLFVSEEELLERNPDVILTTTDFIPDPIGEIMVRPGFDALTAVQNGDVFRIDANSGSRPSQHITKALREMAEAIFPEYYK